MGGMLHNTAGLTNNPSGERPEKMTGIKKWLLGDPYSSDPATRAGILAQKNMSVSDLADATAQYGKPLWRATIYYWMNGDRVPTVESLDLICRVLDYPLEEALKFVETTKLGKPRGTGGSPRSVTAR